MKIAKINKMKRIENLEDIILELEDWKEGDSLSSLIKQEIGIVNDSSHRDILIEFIKGNIEIAKDVSIDDGKLYLKEIIEIEKPEFGSNNLILAPVGSGKTTLIKETLIKEQVGKILILVSNTTLKDSVCPNNLELRKKIGHRMYTSKNQNKYGEEDYKIHVMTYAEFGEKIKANGEFVKDIKQIHCDEIHSLPEYAQYTSTNNGLTHALRYLFQEYDDKQIFYFTATKENLDDWERKQPGSLIYVKTFDYREHPDIKRYMALSEYKINHIEQIRPHLKARKRSFDYFGYKCLAFSRTITSQKRIEEIAIEEGFNPLVLWSINNEDNELSEEQLKARTQLINTGEIPKPYNFLIINSAMQEGWDLKDGMIKLAIMNTTNETEHIQALGRIRGDIDILVYRTKREDDPEISIKLPKRFFNVPLTSGMKNELSIELNIINTKGLLSKWNVIKKHLIEENYIIEDGYEYIDGKRVRVSTITK